MTDIQKDHCYIETKCLCNHFKEYIVNIDNNIEEPFKYRNLFKILSEAKKDDKITFVVNCLGGQINTLLQLIKGIEDCKAKTKSIVHTACSSAVGLFMACDDIKLNSYSYIMIHNIGRYIDDEKIIYSKEMIRQKFDIKIIEKIDSKYRNKLLTDEEIESLKLGDVEIYLTGDEAMERLNV
ncbi:MAG: hypothetical protein GY804_02860 [Alphaproteobacteria bacterium]|nr:hypothetical protein [Alphaproteobacteria bacterium]